MRHKKPTPSSVTTTPCNCGWLERTSDDPSNPVLFDRDLQEFNISRSDGGILRIYHCPWCGGAAPPSKRSRLFAIVTQSEADRLERLLHKFSTLEEAIRVLGPPDKDSPRGILVATFSSRRKAPRQMYARCLKYTRLSKTADIDLFEDPRRGVSFAFGGKHLGKRRRPRSSPARRSRNSR